MKKTLLLISIILPLFLFSQQIEKHISYGGESIGFWEYKPTTYSPTNPTKYPLIIFLHGVGERGNGTSDLYKVKVNSVPKDIAAGNQMRFYVNGKWHEFLVLSPQCSYKYGMWPSLYVDGLIQYAETHLNIDRSRIYLMGLSMGGGGTIRYASESFAHASKLAAIATVCAPTVQYNNCNIASARLPLWTFQANDDKIVNISAISTIVNSILACAPAIKPLKTVYPTGGHSVWTKAFDPGHAYQSPNVFEWMLRYSRGAAAPAPGNQRPVAAAGANKTVVLPAGARTQLLGTGSKDPDGTLRSVSWTKIGGPASIKFETSKSLNTYVNSLVAGTYVFRLTVADNLGLTAYDDVTVVVRPPGSTPAKPATPPVSSGNRAPIPVVSPQINLTLPVNYTRLSGERSNDPDGYVSWLQWSKISGPASYGFDNIHRANVKVYGLTAGTYVFRIDLKDNRGAVSHGDVTVVVRSKAQASAPPATPVKPPPSSNPVAGNKAPLARAANDQLIHLPVNFARLSGEKSYDPDGYLSSINWSKISGPASFRIDNSRLANAKLTNLVAGTYVFRLTVRDNKNAVSYDDIVIRVNARPISRAGANQTIRLPMNGVNLNASGSTDAGGWIKSLVWTKISGPSSFRIVSPTSAVTRAENLTAGLYAFRVTTTDGDGASTYDEMLVTVLKDYTNGSASTLDETSRGDSSLGFSRTGSGAFSKAGLSLYPNPALSFVNLNMNVPESGKAIISIYDVSGKLVKAEQFNKDPQLITKNINVSSLNRGVYMVRLTIGTRTIGTQKFVKQ